MWSQKTAGSLSSAAYEVAKLVNSHARRQGRRCRGMRLIGSMADGLGTVEPRAVDIGWIPEAAGGVRVAVVFCGVKGGQERSRREGEERKVRIMR
jgi:hypothetical protein